jgi:malonyl CoA-acyl carrier protein transacylase
MRFKGFVQEDCSFAGHSLGEYSALASIADVFLHFSLEANAAQANAISIVIYNLMGRVATLTLFVRYGFFFYSY